MEHRVQAEVMVHQEQVVHQVVRVHQVHRVVTDQVEVQVLMVPQERQD